MEVFMRIVKSIIFTVIYFALSSFFTGCKESSLSDVFDEGGITILVSTPEIYEPIALNAKADASGLVLENTQTVDLEGGDFIKVSLNQEANAQLKEKVKLASESEIKQYSKLSKGTRYSLYVYGSDGKYITHRNYIAGSESKTEELKVSGGRSFTFVAYSVNSASSLPEVIDYQKLSTSKLNDVNQDLMYFKETIDVVESKVNVLSIVLRHQFTLVTTTIQLTDEEGNPLDNSDSRNLYNVNDIVFSNVSASAALNFSDHSLIFDEPSSQTTVMGVFDTLASDFLSLSKKKTTKPTLLLGPEGTVANVTIPAMTISEDSYEHTKGNITIPNIKVRPGYKYDLILKIYKVPTKPGVVTNKEGTPALVNHMFSKNGQTDTYYSYTTSADLDYGLTMDIHEMDNSFNLVINNRPIAVSFNSRDEQVIANDTYPPNEIEFQSTWRSAGNSSNIMFKDYDMYEHYVVNGERVKGYKTAGVEVAESIKSVWDVIGDYEHPTIRVVISPSGKVDIYGAKKSKKELYPMEFRTDNDIPTTYIKLKHQDVTWNKNSSNTIVITQKKDGDTVIKGSIRGFKTK